MAQIPSYTTGSLKLSDYLIGTDVSAENVTRSMPVSDIVSSILAAKTIGTVTSISTSDSTYITLAGGPITTTGSLTASLSASGTPSSATYLRGDGTWSEPGPTPTDIITLYNGNSITNDTTQWKFTGTGVSAGSSNNNVTLDIPGLLSSVESIINADGITATGTVTTNPSTGVVTITNAGVYQATQGGNVTLTGNTSPLQYSGNVTVNTRANAGKIIAVDASVGTTVANNVTNPLLDVDFAGSDNYVAGGESIEVISSDDIINFQDLSASEVKSTKLNTLPASALVAVKSNIDAGDNGVVVNTESPNYPNVWDANEIVTLTITDYNQICPGNTCDENTLYLIVGAGTLYTVNLVYANWNSVVYSTGGVASQSDYNITTEVDDGNGYVDVTGNPFIQGIAGTNYTFRTTVNGLNNYTVSNVSGNITTGTISGNATETQTVAATLTPPAGGNCTLVLQLYDGTQGSGGGSGAFPQNPANFTISGQHTTGSQITVPQGTQYTFSLTASASNPYSWTNSAGTTLGSPTYSGLTGTAPFQSGPVTVNATIGGYLNVLTTYSASWTPTIGTFTGSGAAYVAANLNITPNGQTSYGYVAGASYTFLAPAVVLTYQVPGGTLTIDPGYTWKEGITPIWVGGAAYVANIPNPGQSVSKSFEITGNATFTATGGQYTVASNYNTSGITFNGGSSLSNITFSPPNSTATGCVGSGVGYDVGGSGASTPTATVTGSYSGTLTPTNTNARALTGTETVTGACGTNSLTSDWSWSGTINAAAALANVSITFDLGNIPYSTPAQWFVSIASSNTSGANGTFSSNAISQSTFYWSGSGWLTSNPGAQFDIGNGTITINVSRVGTAWCKTSPTSYCTQYAQGCTLPNNYGCSPNVPVKAGSILYYINGFQQAPIRQWYVGNGFDQVTTQTTTTTLSAGQTLNVKITEK